MLLVGFGAYIAAQTVLPNEPQLPSLNLINIIPFRVVWDTYKQVVFEDNYNALLINLVGNIVIFMPIGFLYGLCYRKTSAKRAALIGFLCSLAAETGQLFSERCSDIDDLWLNTLGALAGYGVYLLIRRLAPLFTELFKVCEGNNHHNK